MPSWHRVTRWTVDVPLLVALSLPLAAAAEDWPHWRGPRRDDVTAEVAQFRGKDWPGPVAWQGNFGAGSNSPVVAGGRLYLLGWRDGSDTVYCLDAASGKELWKQSYPCPEYGRTATGDEGQYNGPSATAEYDPATGYLYSVSTDGDLNCWNTKKGGEKAWGFNLHDRYAIERRPQVGKSGRRDYGFTTAPLVRGDELLVQVGAKEGSVVAFDKRTGRERWRSELREPGGHAGGLVPMTVEGVPCVVVLTHFNLAVLRLDVGRQGQTVATYPWVTEFANSIATPAVRDEHVLVTAAYNHRTICKVKVTLRGAEKVWEQPYPSGVCSPVIHKGHVYLAWHTVRCLDFETGEEKWAGGRLNAAGSCVVTGDDKLVVWGGLGQLWLAETAEQSPNRFEVLAERKVLRALAWPHVVLADGRLYVKDRAGNFVCFDLRPKDGKVAGGR